MSTAPKTIIFTDLDGSLLDHHDYQCDDALDYLAELEAAEIPVIFTTSKTRPEVIKMRSELGNRHPFIVENGAGIVIPEDYPIPIDRELLNNDGYHAVTFGRGRDHWVQLLTALKEEFNHCFTPFSDLSIEEISRITGLHQDSASLAAKRDYGEPVQWFGPESKLPEFKSRLTALGATVVSGGRFLHVGDSVSKGKALEWLAYRYSASCAVTTVAVGDSENDLSMLEAADHAVVVKSAKGTTLSVSPKENKHTCYTQSIAPLGWVEGVSDILGLIRFPNRQSRI